MIRSARPLLFALLGALTLLVVANTSVAQYRGFRARVVRRNAFPPNRMPGWDWWRTYPWSPYNYGRNPYNPIVYPYPPPYSYYGPYNGGSPPPSDGEPQSGAGDSQQSLVLPHPSGPDPVPPPDAAVVQLNIPDRFGEVFFDDVKTSSIGTTRFYVTPSLSGDKPMSYTVKANFQRGGQTISEERTVKVSPGKTTVIDFTKPDGGKAK